MRPTLKPDVNFTELNEDIFLKKHDKIYARLNDISGDAAPIFIFINKRQAYLVICMKMKC
jgi:hypothetical protein